MNVRRSYSILDHNRANFDVAHDLDITIWSQTVQYVVNDIRTITSNNWILVPGTTWQALDSWVDDTDTAMSSLNDTANKLLFDVHQVSDQTPRYARLLILLQYLDSDGGNTGDCSDFNSTYLSAFNTFFQAMNASGHRAILTEFGGSQTPVCNSSLEDMLRFVENKTDNFVGWAVWGPGLDADSKLYLNPGDASLSVADGQINLVRDVLAPHMRSRNSAASRVGLRDGAGTGMLSVLVFLIMFYQNS